VGRRHPMLLSLYGLEPAVYDGSQVLPIDRCQIVPSDSQRQINHPAVPFCLVGACDYQQHFSNALGNGKAVMQNENAAILSPEAKRSSA